MLKALFYKGLEDTRKIGYLTKFIKFSRETDFSLTFQSSLFLFLHKGHKGKRILATRLVSELNNFFLDVYLLLPFLSADCVGSVRKPKAKSA